MRPQPGFIPHVTTLGRGPRRVLALHCTLAFGGAWAGLAKVMGADLTFVAPDMPSHGRSADWDGVSSFADTVYAGSMAQLTEPMDVIGHSFGAATALRLAVDHPDRVRSLTMIEPVFFAVAFHDAPETREVQRASDSVFMSHFNAGDMEEAARAFNRMWSDGPAWNDLSDRSRAAMARGIRVVPDTTAFLYEDALGLLVPGRLDSVTMPTLLLRGEVALPTVIATNNGLTRRIPDATQAVIDGAGHMAPISLPQDVAAAIAELLHRS